MPIQKQRALLNSGKALSSSIMSRDCIEIIPDSEEDREQREQDQSHSKNFIEVIEISSDDSEDDIVVKQSPKKPSTLFPNTPKRTSKQKPHYSRTRIIESSDDASNPDIVEISDSSFEVTELKTLSGKTTAVASQVEHTSKMMVVDESIIIFDDPKSARTPIRMSKKRAYPTNQDTVPQMPDIMEDNPSLLFPDYRPGPSKLKESTSGSTPVAVKAKDAPRRNTKKAQVEAEQKRRHAYAQQLFNDLNQHVFQKGLPEGTKLNWSKRLLTTAGRAKYHRSREGVQTTEIELAEKILDCDERIRNTLSHEMCHLATWIIDKKIDEHHGKLFKFWANRVMGKRPDILVSIKHDYEISYPFNWECEKCTKTYGRFSKSIRPDECRCGACKEGILVPLFKTRASRNTPKLSRMAASKPQDSPRATQDIGASVGELWQGSDPGAEIREITNILALATLGGQ